jgi:hypothetical protein
VPGSPDIDLKATDDAFKPIPRPVITSVAPEALAWFRERFPTMLLPGQHMQREYHTRLIAQAQAQAGPSQLS